MPRDWSERKGERWVTAVFFFLSGFISASWSSRIPDVQQKLQLNNAAWGSVLFVLPAGLLTGLLVSSWLVTRFGTHRVMLLSCLASATLLCLLGLAGNSFALAGVLFFFGFMRTLFSISVNTRSISVQQLYHKPIVASFHGLWSVACLLAIGLGTLMIVRDVRPVYHFLIVAGVCALTCLRYRQQGRPLVVPEKRPLWVRPDRYLLLLGAIAYCAMVCEGAMFDWSINYFKNVVQAGGAWVTAGYAAFIGTMALGRLLGDKVVARLGPFAVLCASGLLMASGLMVAAAFPFLYPAALGFLLVGLGDSVIVPVVYVLAARSTRMQPSYAIASVTLIGYLGFLTGPLLIGFVSEGWGMQWSLAIVGLLCLCICLLAIGIKKYL